jgi:4-amino-4-deoxy-L-arabinose transferase-like glycosyltransferase
VKLARWELAVVGVLFAAGLALRVSLTANHYVFAGSDSYGYVHLADELRTHGRYALGPEPEPLHYARMPLYPLFLIVAKGAARAEMTGGDGWLRIVYAQIALDLLVTVLLTWLMARRLGGRAAGLGALALALFVPFHAVQVTSALTETLATALATATVAALVLLRDRPRLAFALAGAGVALSTLVRPDGLLVAFALAPAALTLRGGWRERLIASGIAAAAFVVVFAPWPARNHARFGKAWALGTRVDRFQKPVANWEGIHHFLQSYGRDWQTFNYTTTCLFDRACTPGLDRLAADGAIDDAAQREELSRLLALRARTGNTPEVSAGFDAIASAHRRHHPLRVFVWLPLRRAVLMWTDAFDEIFQHPPLPRVYAAIAPALPALAIALFVLLLASAATLALQMESRRELAILVTAIAGRTAVLAWTFYTMPRYIREVTPLAYVLIGWGAVEICARLRRVWSRKSKSA